MDLQELMPAYNLTHNVSVMQKRDSGTSLIAMAEQYCRTQVAGQAEGTMDAKQRDLASVVENDTKGMRPIVQIPKNGDFS